MTRDLTRARDGRATVDSVNLTLEEGELLSILGPSGCGKTTLLRLLAGLEAPQRGTIDLDGRRVNDPSILVGPKERRVGMLFQDLALWPHLSVEGHLELVLRGAKLSRAERKHRIDEQVTLFRLEGMKKRRPSELSGGECQRLALARSVITGPRLWLLDEPLSSLDAPLREELLTEIRAIHERLALTTVFVTHDQQEALGLTGQLAVMNRGRIEQLGAAIEVYENPENLFVATFVGRLNVVSGRMVAARTVETSQWSIELPFPLQASYQGSELSLGFRPEWIGLTQPGRGLFEAEVDLVRFAGDRRLVTLRAPGLAWTVIVRDEAPLSPGDRVGASVNHPALVFASDGTRLCQG